MGLAVKTAPSFYRLMNRKKRIYRAISIVSLFVMAAAILSLCYTLILYQRSNREYQALAREARLAAEARAEAEQQSAAESEPGAPEAGEPAETAEPVEEQEPGAAEPKEYAVIPIDFDLLTGMNEDIIGWVEVPGTGVDYPILYDSTKTMYYLNHSHLRVYSPYGSVFMLSENAPDFSDFNTVIYGHNMLDGSMFASLHEYEDQDFFDENRYIIVYTPDRVRIYEIFAAYRTDNLNQLRNFTYETRVDRQFYIGRIFMHTEKAIFAEDPRPTPDDRILTLSTCIINPAYRYLVQGVLISEQEGIPLNVPVG